MVVVFIWHLLQKSAYREMYWYPEITVDPGAQQTIFI